MFERASETIKEHGLLTNGQSVLVALSGGPDSVALLSLLCRLRERMRLRLRAVYINHGLRPKPSQKEEEFCQKLCDQLRVDLHIVREHIRNLARSAKKGVEEAGRDFRYGVFEAMAKEDNIDRVALGHHADDRVETILFNLFRGAGPTGMVGMPIQRGKIVRPLYHCSKEEILGYLKEQKLEHCRDLSNESNRFTRNFIRNRLLPQIRERVNPKVNEAILGLSELLAEESEALTSMAEQAAARLIKRRPGRKIELPTAPLVKLDDWLRRRVLRKAVAQASGSDAGIDRAVTRRLDTWLDSKAPSLSLPDGVQVERTGKSIVLHRPVETSYQIPLRPGADGVVESLGLTFRCKTIKRTGRLSRRRQADRVMLDRDKVTLPLIVRSIRQGDRFIPLGMTGEKKVSDFLIDRKVPRVYRDEIPVVSDHKGIVWLVGQEIADRAKVEPKTKEILTIECIRRKDD